LGIRIFQGYSTQSWNPRYAYQSDDNDIYTMVRTQKRNIAKERWEWMFGWKYKRRAWESEYTVLQRTQCYNALKQLRYSR